MSARDITRHTVNVALWVTIGALCVSLWAGVVAVWDDTPAAAVSCAGGAL